MRLLDVVIRHFFVDGHRACGLAIWQYCDMRAFNNKGLVDEYRRPKQAYEVVKQSYRQLKASR